MWLSGQNTGWGAGDLVRIPNVKSYGISEEIILLFWGHYLICKRKNEGRECLGSPSNPRVTFQSLPQS